MCWKWVVKIRMESARNSSHGSPKSAWKTSPRSKERRSYAYVTAIQRKTEEECENSSTEYKTRLARTKSESDLTNNDDEELVQSSLKVNGRQNLTVSAGSGSVFYFHYPLPYDEQCNNSSRRGSVASYQEYHVVEDTDGIACDEDVDDNTDDDEIRNASESGVDISTQLDKARTLYAKNKAEPVPSISVPRQQRRLVLIGYTGGGKSETGNSILCDRDLFDSLPGFASITKDCQKSSGKDIRNASTTNSEVVVVDTPGLFDTNDDPEVIAKKITGCIINVSPGPHAILLVTPIARMTTEVQQAADGLRKLFGDRSLQYMIVVFTHLDAIKRKKSIKGIEQMISMAPPALFRILQECNNRYVAFDNTLDPESSENKKQVTNLLNLIDEMVDANGGHCYTNDLLEEANRLMEMEKKRHEREIEEKFKEREARIRTEYEKHLAIIDAKQHQLEEVQEQRRQLEENRSKELQRKIERQQSQIRTKEEAHAKVLETEKSKYTKALESMNKTLHELQLDFKTVEAEKAGLAQREAELSTDLLSAIAERDRTTKYLDQLEKELERELNVPVKIDPSKPPKSIVEVVTKRVRRCPIL